MIPEIQLTCIWGEGPDPNSSAILSWFLHRPQFLAAPEGSKAKVCTMCFAIDRIYELGYESMVESGQPWTIANIRRPGVKHFTPGHA